uniref:Ribonuclease H-like domain-containing protein n=1 Tax=Tanacetum cinerariifolium TaxID=118510 RepID=A0A699H7A5_TANCI|nr:ribonuclease H-like domain-containing protein [Tanacetum cinerariifolium]
MTTTDDILLKLLSKAGLEITLVFVRDNNCTIEFGAFGFSVKDFMTRRVLLRCDSMRDLYLVIAPSPIPHAFLKKYVVKILDRAHTVNCNPSRTPIDIESKLGSDGDLVSDSTLYRSLPGSLIFLDFKRILWYIYGTLDYGLQLFTSSTTDLVAYSYADWAGDPTTRCSTLGSGSSCSYSLSVCNIFTKGLPSALFEEFRSSLSI